MRTNIWHECLCFAVYYAPRGRRRLLMLGESIAQRYLVPNDQLIGILGESGIGKSSIIKGMFPGMELTNDDDGVNVRPLPLMRMHRDGKFTARTFHIDVRFEMAFTQLYEIADAIRAALMEGKRVVVEHFDVVYPLLGINAQFLLGVGEEIYVSRPDLFGPFPENIAKAIEGTAQFRKMAHSAEDLTSFVLERDLGIAHPEIHSDVPRGFVIEFDEKPVGLDVPKVEAAVKALIAQGLDISYQDDEHIRIGEAVMKCTGPRIHVRNSSEIESFRIVPDLYYDDITSRHCLVGLVGEPKVQKSHFVRRYPGDVVPTPAVDTPEERYCPWTSNRTRAQQ